MNQFNYFKNLPAVMLLFILPLVSFSQAPKWYLQVGGGYSLVDQIEQLHFNRTGPSGLIYAEVGRTFKPLTIGVQQNVMQSFKYYKYRMNMHAQTIYAKYSINHVSDLLPHGLDPYFMAGATLMHTSLDTYLSNDLIEKLDRMTAMRPTYTFGAGVQIGSRHLVLGLHYQYTPGKDSFQVLDSEALEFATGLHQFTIDVGFRIFEPNRSKRGRCPRFGGKGIIRF